MTRRQVLDSLEEVIALLGTYDITTIRASMGMYLCCKAIHEQTDVRVLMTGEISDELFGYKYTDFAPSAEAFQQEAKKRVDELYMYDVLRADRCISVNSLEAQSPLRRSGFRQVRHVHPPGAQNEHLRHGQVPPAQGLCRRSYPPRRYPLAAEGGLLRRRRPFDGRRSEGIRREPLLRRSLRQGLRRNTASQSPFTKESLLYRDIFEKYYPGQAEMVKDFWMPNKSWKGCDVQDPSARVLSNYGASGV